MDSEIVQFLDLESTMEATRDCRIVALRWDIFLWDLVLDIDAPISEAKNAPERRTWLIFLGLSELTWPLERACVPSGCFGTSSILVRPCGNSFEHIFNIIAPTYFEDKEIGNPTKTAIIKAQKIVGVASRKTIVSEKEPGLDWNSRRALAKDDDFIDYIKRHAGYTSKS